ncbi:MAG: bifunctional demethylmenaquinone methyltransferase/2-methoxy-6-polyprenyl-1,4-benzoquinol methylase UbiE [Candidatus Latescibacteria bacterium]|nr:bifunctional demethylmenaquinone methyltransferase/2-methoxy-6-polyprenyl-1,4-benzoquinol methylase UbiE [Candidatus Latescibacterota bacterium]
MDNTDNIKERKQRIQGMFNSIARRYDLLNHLLSGGIDRYWRWRALKSVRHAAPRRILDLATGTGDFALSARRLAPTYTVGVDVALNMLRLGVNKVARRPGPAPLRLLGGDAEQLPFREASFDLVTVAFGVRNFGSIPAGLAEAFRVLKPGGELVVLDFSEPGTPVFRPLYRFYFTRVLPLVGGLISGNRQAYSYLPRSVGTFPQGQAFIDLLEEAGFSHPLATSLSWGISSLYQGFKPPVPVD